jgi:N-acyl-L-homoserine lactone synthetase
MVSDALQGNIEIDEYDDEDDDYQLSDVDLEEADGKIEQFIIE